MWKYIWHTSIWTWLFQEGGIDGKKCSNWPPWWSRWDIDLKIGTKEPPRLFYKTKKIWRWLVNNLVNMWEFFWGGRIPETESTFFQWHVSSHFRVYITQEFFWMASLIGLKMFITHNADRKSLKTFYRTYFESTPSHNVRKLSFLASLSTERS